MASRPALQALFQLSGIDPITSAIIATSYADAQAACFLSFIDDYDDEDDADCGRSVCRVIGRSRNLLRNRGYATAAMEFMRDETFERMFRLPRSLFDTLLHKVSDCGCLCAEHSTTITCFVS